MEWKIGIKKFTHPTASRRGAMNPSSNYDSFAYLHASLNLPDLKINTFIHFTLFTSLFALGLSIFLSSHKTSFFTL